MAGDSSHEFEGKPLQSVTRRPRPGRWPMKRKTAREWRRVSDWSRVSRLRSPSSQTCALPPVDGLAGLPVAGAHDLGAHFERLLKAAGQKCEQQPVLEINPSMPWCSDSRGERCAALWRLGSILFDQALLSEASARGSAGFVARVNSLCWATEIAAFPAGLCRLHAECKIPA